MHLSRRLPLIAYLVTLATSNVACTSASQPHEHPEDITIGEIIADLGNDSEIRFDRARAEVQARGKMFYGWGKASKALQPADEAFWPVTITYAKDDDGSHTVLTGSVVYSCPPGATGPWRYNRFWFQGSERLGVKAPRREELRNAVLNGMRSMTKLWFRPPERYFAVHDVSIPDDLEYKSSDPTVDSWNVKVVALHMGSGTRVDRVRILFRAERHQGEDNRVWFGVPKILQEEVLSSQELPPNAIRSMPNLGDTSFDTLFSPASNGSPSQKDSAALNGPTTATKPSPRESDPGKTAKAFLSAYQAKKLPAMADLSVGAARQVIADVASQGESHPRYAAIFSGWRWDAAAAWNGRIEDVRFRGADDALVRFADLVDGHVAAVNLQRVDDRWGFLGIDQILASEFESLQDAQSPNDPGRNPTHGVATAKAQLSTYQQQSLSEAANANQAQPTLDQAAADAVRITLLRDGYEARVCNNAGDQLVNVRPGDNANDVAMSADGRRIAVLRDQYEVKLYDVAGKLLGRFKPGDKSQAIAMSGDSSRIAVLRDSYQVRVFDEQGTKLAEFHTGDKAQDVAMSADGQRIAVLRDEYEVKMFDPSGQLLGEFKPGSKLQAIALNGDGTRIAILRDSYEVRICDDTGKQLGNIKTGSNAQDVAVSADGNWLAVVRDQFEVKLFHSSGNVMRIKPCGELQRVALGLITAPETSTLAAALGD